MAGQDESGPRAYTLTLYAAGSAYSHSSHVLWLNEDGVALVEDGLATGEGRAQLPLASRDGGPHGDIFIDFSAWPLAVLEETVVSRSALQPPTFSPGVALTT